MEESRDGGRWLNGMVKGCPGGAHGLRCRDVVGGERAVGTSTVSRAGTGTCLGFAMLFRS